MGNRFLFLRFSKLIKNQRGVSLGFTILTTTALVSAVAYTVITQLPRLHSENSNMSLFLNYKTMITGVNDYVINALRERWCLRESGTGTELVGGHARSVVYTDLFPSETACRPGDPLESIVMYPGNLERLFWNEDTVGVNPPGIAPANTIIGLNQIRLGLLVNPASVRLNANEVRLREMNFFIKSEDLQNLTDAHPLYIITRDARKCLDGIFIRLAISDDVNNLPVGDERRVEIEVHARLKTGILAGSCGQYRMVQSKAFYSFYPRALNTYALIKSGDLATSFYHEYNSPVYVAGDVWLPGRRTNKNQASVFYAPVTIGFKPSGGSGKLISTGATPFTFAERGVPQKTRQDNYSNFRGFLGGITLDPAEDKGFRYLFESVAVPSGTAKLEQCIELAEIYANPNVTSDSQLAYQVTQNSSLAANIKLGLTKKNLFRRSNEVAGIMMGQSAQSMLTLHASPNPVPVSAREFGSMNISDSSGVSFSATIGSGAGYALRLNLDKLDLLPDTLDGILASLEGASYENFDDVIPVGHVLAKLPEFANFKKAGKALKVSCEKSAGPLCVPFGFTEKCDSQGNLLDLLGAIIPGLHCNNSVEANAYSASKSALKKVLSSVRNDVALQGEAELKISIADPPQVSEPDTKKLRSVLNVVNVSLQATEKWTRLVGYATSSLAIEVLPSHVANSFQAKLKFSVNLVGNLLSLPHQGSWVGSSDNIRLPRNRLNPDRKQDEIIDIECPDGLGVADWDLDMSPNTSFSWNYANTQAGAIIENIDHSELPLITFAATGAMREGHAASTSKSIVNRCVIPKNRTHVYGFYVCRTLEIEKGRTQPLTIIGTFIVKNIINNNRKVPVIWQTVWDPRSAPLIYDDLKGGCNGMSTDLNWKNLMLDPRLATMINQCGAVDMVNNGPNNFTWTTVDPEIGLARSTDVMTSQKVKRPLRWIVREDSRQDVIK